MKQLNSFNTDNNSAYKNDFWRINDIKTQKSNNAENSALFTEINRILKYIQIGNEY